MKRQFQKKEAAAQKKQPGIATTKVKIHAVATLVLKVRRQERNLQKPKRKQQKRKYPPVRTRVIPVRAKMTFPFLRSSVIPPVT